MSDPGVERPDAAAEERLPRGSAAEPLLRPAGTGTGTGTEPAPECPICNEPFDAHGERRVTRLHCDHAVCRVCVGGILRGGPEPGRLPCPFCRQTTPFPRWEIQRLQDESYHDGAPQPGPAAAAAHAHAHAHARAAPAPEPAGSDPLCLPRSAALLLLLLPAVGYLLYKVVPAALLSLLRD